MKARVLLFTLLLFVFAIATSALNDTSRLKPLPDKPKPIILPPAPANVTVNKATGRYGCWKTCTSISCSDGGRYCTSSLGCQAFCGSCKSCWAWGCGWFGAYWDCGVSCSKCGGTCSYTSSFYCKSSYSCWGECPAKPKGRVCTYNYECRSNRCKKRRCA